MSYEFKLVFAFNSKFGYIRSINRFHAERIDVLPETRKFAVYVSGVFPIGADAQSYGAVSLNRKLTAKLHIRGRAVAVRPNPFHTFSSEQNMRLFCQAYIPTFLAAIIPSTIMF